MDGQSALEDNWKKRNKCLPEKFMRKSIQYGLHDTIQDKLNLKHDNYCLVFDERFNEYLETIKHNKMHRKETHRRAQKSAILLQIQWQIICLQQNNSQEGKERGQEKLTRRSKILLPLQEN